MVLPEWRESDFERSLWSPITNENEEIVHGKIPVSLLEKFAAKKEKVLLEETVKSEFGKGEGYTFYYIIEGCFHSKLAYTCPECKQTRTKPEFEDFNTISLLSGSKGYNILCSNIGCGELLYKSESIKS